MDAYMDWLPDDEDHREGRERSQAIREFAAEVLGCKGASDWTDLECGEVADLFERVLREEFE
jgi:hypothetical protein